MDLEPLTKPGVVAVSESKLSQLYTGLLVLTLKKEMDEPGYAAINMMTFEHELIQKRNRYARELQRILNELKLTRELLAEIEVSRQFKHKTHEPEELINYYSGVFFDLVHQLKDKLFRLVACLITEKPAGQAYKEPKKTEVSKFLKDYEQTLKKIGIHELLKKWQQKEAGPIGVILCRRTQHHHTLSRLELNSDFQNVQMSKTMLGPLSVNTLTDCGKQRLVELGEQSFKKMKADITAKQQKAVQEMEGSLDAIAEKLIAYYGIPIDSSEWSKIGQKYMDFLASLEIANEASRDKISPPIMPLISDLVSSIQKLSETVSIYLVGSSCRDDFMAGTSDINVYIITKGLTEPLDIKFPLTVTLLSEEDFLSEKHKRDRFICWSDGVLLSGKQFDFKAGDFPKPGALLCSLLNHGFIEQLEALKVEISALKNPSISQLRTYSLAISKIMMDYDFGVAMSNKPYYTASRKKKIAYTKEIFPKERRSLMLEQVYNGGIIKHADFPMLIDTFLENAKMTYQKILAVEEKALRSSDSYHSYPVSSPTTKAN